MRQPPRPVERGAIINADHLIYQGCIIVFGKHVHADTFDLVRFGSIPRVDRAWRVRANDLDIRILFFEVTSYSRDCPSRTNASDKSGDTTSGVRPDFWTGCGIVSLRISRIYVLIRTTGTRYFLSKPMCHVLIIIWRFVSDTAWADDNFCTIS